MCTGKKDPLESMDLCAPPVQPLYRGRPVFRSSIGGIITIITVVVTFLCLFTKLLHEDYLPEFFTVLKGRDLPGGYIATF